MSSHHPKGWLPSTPASQSQLCNMALLATLFDFVQGLEDAVVADGSVRETLGTAEDSHTTIPQPALYLGARARIF